MQVTGNSVVLVIAQHNLPEPGTDIDHAIMHPALKLNLDGFEFRNHSLKTAAERHLGARGQTLKQKISEAPK